MENCSLPEWWPSDKPYIIGDCLEGMKQLPDKCVDLVLTDPPYGTNDKYGKNTKRGSKHIEFAIDWDTEMPLNYIPEMYRILKDDTWGVIFIDKKEVTTMWKALEAVGLSPRNTYHLIKINPTPNIRPNFMSGVQTAVVFTKGRLKQKWRGGGATKNYEYIKVNDHEDTGHPTTKPVITYVNLINVMSVEGDIVMDFFLGSGTLLQATRKTNRIGLGFEINPDYEPIIRKRSLQDIKPLEGYFKECE